MSTEQGLSHSTVRCFTQDEKGFIWIGTIGGLNRYDGKSIDFFPMELGDSLNTIGANFNSLLTSKDGNIWIGTAKGVARFNYGSGIFEHLPLNSSDGTSLNVSDIIEDQAGNIWIGTRFNGLYRISALPTNEFNSQSSSLPKHILHIPIAGDAWIYDLQKDPNKPNDIWIGTSKGLYKFDSLSQNLLNFTDSTGKEMNLKSISVDSEGKLWVYNFSDGIYIFDQNKKKYTKFYLPGKTNSILEEKDLESIFFDSKGNLWLCSLGNGLIKINLEEQIKYTFTPNPSDKKSINSYNIISIFEDRNGGFWVGTQGGGCNYFFQNKNQFNNRIIDVWSANSVFTKNITSTFEDTKENLWIGARNNGLYKIRLDRNTGKAMESITFSESATPTSRIRHNLVFCIYETRGGLIFIGTRLGVNIYDPITRRIRDYYSNTGDLDGIKDKTIYTIIEDAQANVWFGTLKGLFMWSESDQKLKFVDTVNTDFESQNKTVHQLFEKENGDMLVMGPSSFYRISQDLVEFENLAVVDNKPFDIGLITSFCQDNNGTFWIGTYDNGLYHYDDEIKNFVNYTTQDGMANITVYEIFEDNNGFLWFSTNKGITKFNTKSKKFYNFSTEDGLQGEEFNSRSGFKSIIDGSMAFGGTNGLNFFHPNEIILDTIAPPIYIKSLKRYRKERSGNQIILHNDIINKKYIVFDSKDYLLQFQISAPEYKSSNNNYYAYQLIGHNNEWIDLGETQNFSFTSLQAGSYVLNVRVRNKNGNWNKEYASLEFTVQPPWWKTWWAYTVYALAILGMFFGIYKYRIVQILKYQNLRTKISSDLHDDVGTLLSSLAMEADMMQYTKKEEHPQIFKKISELSRTAISKMRDTVWVIDSRKDSLADLSNRMSDHLYDLFQHQEKDYTFEAQLSNEKMKLLPDVRQNFYLVFKESVSNFTKHSNGHKLHVVLQQKGKHLRLVVKDDGQVNIDKIRNSGLGLSNMKLRAKNIDAKLTIDVKDGFSIILEK